MMQAAVEEMFGQPRGPLARWLSQKIILDHITRLFLKHLLQKRDSEGKLLYEERICNMCIGIALFTIAPTFCSILHEARILNIKACCYSRRCGNNQHTLSSTADNGDLDADQKQSLQVNLKDTVADPSLKDVCQWVHACPRVVIPALDQATALP